MNFMAWLAQRWANIVHPTDNHTPTVRLNANVGPTLSCYLGGPFRTLKDYVISRTSETFWKSFFSTKININRLIIDCSQIEELHSVKDIDLLYIERLTRNLCFAIHTERLKKLNEG